MSGQVVGLGELGGANRPPTSSTVIHKTSTIFFLLSHLTISCNLAESKNIKNIPKFWEILTQLWKSLNILTETGNCPKVNGTNSTLHNFLNLFWDSALHSPTHFFASDLNSTLFHSLPYISFFLYISDKVRIENLCASVIPDVTLWRVEEDLTGVKL